MAEMKDGSIGWHEATGLMITVMAGKVFLAVPQDMVAKGKSAGWLIILMGTVLGLLGFAIISRLLERFPGKSIIEATEEIAGPYLGVVLSLGYFAFFLVFDILILRSFAETVLTTVLPLTPISVVMGVLMAGMIYCTYQGLEPLSRGAWLVMPFMVAGYMGIVAGVLPYLDTNKIFPILGTGPLEIAKWGALKSSLFSEILFLAVIVPSVRDRDKFKIIGYGSVAMSGLLMIITTLVFIGVFGSHGGTLGGSNPLFQMARLIFLGRFVQRIESLFIFVWVFAALIKLSAGLYGSAVTMARVLKLPVFRPLLFPLGLLIYSAAFLPQSWVVVNRIENDTFRSYGWILTFLLPAAVLALAKVRGKTGLKTREGSQ